MSLRLGLYAFTLTILVFVLVKTRQPETANLDQPLCTNDCISGFKSNTIPGIIEYLAFKELTSQVPHLNTAVSSQSDGDLDGFKSFGINSVHVKTDGVGLISVVLSNSTLIALRYTVILFRLENLNQLNYKGTLVVNLNELNREELVIPLFWTNVGPGLKGEFSISLIQSENTDAVLVTPVRNIGKTLDVKFSPDRGYVSNITFLKQKSIQKDSPIQAVFTFK